MRVTKVEQQNSSRFSVPKAGAVGAGLGALICRVAPLTTDETGRFFNDSVKSSIKEQLHQIRTNEVAKISSEFNANQLKGVSKEAFDIFEKNKNLVVEQPKTFLEQLKGCTDSVKNGARALVSRVDSVSAPELSAITSKIKTNAKGQRSLAYFAVAGALIAMSAQVVLNMFNSLLPKPEKQKEDKTMADLMLDPNSEQLILSMER